MFTLSDLPMIQHRAYLEQVAVEMSDKDFDVVRDALRKATKLYSDDEIANVIIAERAAARVMERLDAQRGE